MSANLTVKPLATTSSDGLAEAIYFSAGNHELFGWLHWPPCGRRANLGLVICKPFGYEALCGHSSLRAFAEMAAASGVPTLRFDYGGTGDSADIDTSANQIEVWSQDVIAAVHELRRCTGVQRVCLLGFRLGAMLATLAATRTDAVHGLILVAPIMTGHRYLGEMRTTRLAASLGAAPAESTRGAALDSEADSGSMEVSGHHVSAATIAELSRVDLAALTFPPWVARLLVIDRSDLPKARAWTESLSQRGIEATYAALPGFIEMMMRAPQFAMIPGTMVACVREWLLRQLGEGLNYPVPEQTLTTDHHAIVAPTTLLFLPGGDSASDGMLSERPVLFGTEASLFGVVTEPRRAELRRRAVILVNAGADYHICAGRIYVSLARHWARHGYVVLRMDLAGLGDSGTRPGKVSNDIFPLTAVEDISAAIAFMREHYKVGEVTLGGLCSGAYHALRAAVAGAPLARILMVNPQNFFWKEGMSIEDIQLAEVIQTPGLYRARARSVERWRRLLAGQVDVLRIARLYAHRVSLALESSFRDLARRLRIRLPRDLGWELEQIAARGVQTTIVFARGEPGIELLRIQAGSSVQRLGSRCRVHIIDNADHTFSRSRPRAVLKKVLSDELFAPAQSRSGAPSGPAGR